MTINNFMLSESYDNIINEKYFLKQEKKNVHRIVDTSTKSEEESLNFCYQSKLDNKYLSLNYIIDRFIKKNKTFNKYNKNILALNQINEKFHFSSNYISKLIKKKKKYIYFPTKISRNFKKLNFDNEQIENIRKYRILKNIRQIIQRVECKIYFENPKYHEKGNIRKLDLINIFYHKKISFKKNRNRNYFINKKFIIKDKLNRTKENKYLNSHKIYMMNRNDEIHSKDNSFHNEIKNMGKYGKEKYEEKKKKKIREEKSLNHCKVEPNNVSTKNKGSMIELKRKSIISSSSDICIDSSEEGSKKKQKEKNIYIGKNFNKKYLKYINCDNNIFNKNRLKRKTSSNNKTIRSFQNNSSEYETCPYVSDYTNSNKILYLSKEEIKSKLKMKNMNMFYDSILYSNMINLDIETNEKRYYSSEKLNNNDNTKNIDFYKKKNISFDGNKNINQSKNNNINNIKNNSYYYMHNNEFKKKEGNKDNITDCFFDNDGINFLNKNILEKSNKNNSSFNSTKNPCYIDCLKGKDEDILLKNKNIYEKSYNMNKHYFNNVLLKFKSLDNSSDGCSLNTTEFIKNISKSENNKLSDSCIYKYNFNYPSFDINASTIKNEMEKTINFKRNLFSNYKSYINKKINLSSSYMNYHSNKCISDSYCEKDIYFSKRDNRLLVPFESLKNYNDECLPSYHNDATHFEKERKIFFDSIKNIMCIMKEIKKIRKNLKEQKGYYSTIVDEEKKKDFNDLIKYLTYQKIVRKELKKYYFNKINKCLFTFLLRSNHLNFSFSENEALLLKKWSKLRYKKSKEKNVYIKINPKDKKAENETIEKMKRINDLYDMETSFLYKNSISNSNNYKQKKNKRRINKNYTINNNIKEEINSHKINNKRLLSSLNAYINKTKTSNFFDSDNKNINGNSFESPFKFCESNKTNIFDIFLFLKNTKLKNIQNKFKKKLKSKCIYLSKINDFNKMLSYIKYIFMKFLKKEVSDIDSIYINDCFINYVICFFLSLLLFIFKNVHTIKIIRCHLYYSYFMIFLNYFKSNNLKYVHFKCNNIIDDKIVDIDNYNKCNQNFIVYFNANYIKKQNRDCDKKKKNNKNKVENLCMNNDTFENSSKKKVSKIKNKKNSFYDKNKKDLIFFDQYGFYDYFSMKQKKKKISCFSDDLKSENLGRISLNKENINIKKKYNNRDKENFLFHFIRKECDNNLYKETNGVNSEENLNNSIEPIKLELFSESRIDNEEKNELKELSNPLKINEEVENKKENSEYNEINTYNIHSSSCNEENDSEDSLQELNECVSSFTRKSLDYMDLNKIKVLKLCSNKLNDNALMYISTLIKKNKLNNMRILDLRWNNFTYKSLITLSFALTNTVKSDSFTTKKVKKLKLRKLLLSGNNINSSLYSSFLSSFCTCNFVVVETLDFSMNKIDNESFPITYKYFKHILQLQKHKKQKNKIHDVFINLDHNNLKNSIYINKLIKLLKKFPIKNYREKGLRHHKNSKEQRVVLSLQYNNIKNTNAYEVYECFKERIKI
ncbi:conserved Plasmodium protein, unknown function [Plasmodium relictum]|uniref:Uncharacterized protein n=1 Tax=Plasmodium relictum TaxID=85471 RepID=A0A1J1H8H9_PLARL|nr:conserved Plasmodium protein, unknown function [Plasmodium relictum]CRG99744.1 conserved Plasmodium protein, unknown function [Plasmodium relictum]